MDHTHSGGTRHAPVINYFGFFVSFNEIDVDWNVPGAGSGSNSWKRIAYTGNIDVLEKY